MQRVIEGGGEGAVRAQLRVVGECSDAAKTRPARPVPGRPRVIVVSGEGTESVLQTADHYRRALDSLHWPYSICVPDEPSKCHIAARMQAIREFDPDVIICLNRGAEPLRSLLPESLPIITWTTGASPPMSCGMDKIEKTMKPLLDMVTAFDAEATKDQ
jgi:hypothetical protein